MNHPMRCPRFVRLCLVATVICGGAKLLAADETLIPLNELGKDTYHGFVGGLYADGKNIAWGAHAEALKRMSGRVQPLNADGKPDPKGKIVFAGVGASVCKQLFDEIEKEAPTHAEINPAVMIVNCSSGGQDVNKIADPAGRYWDHATKMLDEHHVTAAQVQVVWYQSDDLRDTRDDFPGRPQRLREEFAEQLRLIEKHFPSARLCYFSARHTTAFMPDTTGASVKHAEPRPYQNGWAIKWLIEEQSAGRADLKFEGEGAVAPLAAWSTYFWTDGEKPRSDGYRWTKDDVVKDGVHLSPTARPRVAAELLTFFATDPYARTWFVASGAATVKPVERANVPVARGDAKPSDAATTRPVAAAPAIHKDAGPEDPAWVINAKNKMPKLARVLNTTGYVRVVVRDSGGKQVAEVRDVFKKHTDLNKVVGTGQYHIEFFDKDDKPIRPTGEPAVLVLLK